MTQFDVTVCGNPAQRTSDKSGGTQMRKIKVNEIFGPTVQGEGRTMGKPVKFLRTSGCNLACIWCDTPFTWNWKDTKFAHPDKYDKSIEQHEMSIDEIKSALDKIGSELRSLVISGGEPLIQQKSLVPLLQVLKDDGYWVEVETNGTVPPSKDFVALVNQINCSPKLSNSENPAKLRIRSAALEALVACGKANFKFVIQDKKDLDEVLTLVATYGMKEVRLMPECRTPEELLEKEAWLKPLCESKGFIYGTRISILNGNKRGE